MLASLTAVFNILTLIKECPGGADNPCDFHGECNIKTGKCTCDPNWNGNNECSKCSEGWFGRFCSVAYVEKSENETLAGKVCSVTENGHVAGFDGSFFSFGAVGEFVMINSTDVQAQIRQIPCQGSSVCINAFGIKIRNLHISLHAPYEKNEKPIVHVDGKRFNSVSDRTESMRVLNVSVWPVSSSTYRLTASDYLSIKASFYNRYVILESIITDEFCQNIDGLCGSCAVMVTPGHNTTQNNGSSISTQDGVTILGGITTGEVIDGNLDEYIKKKLSVSTKVDSSVIVIDEERKETRVVYGGGHTLYFNFSVIASNAVLNVFDSDAVTLEFLVKSCNPRICGGPILSYTSNEAFYISNEITVKVVIGMQVYDTGIPTEADKWNQISVVVVRSKLKMFVYLVSSSGLVKSKRFVLKTFPFIGVGTLAIGLWQPPSGTQTIQPSSVFRGNVDEMRVWKKMHDYAMVKQSWGTNIQPGIPSLTGLWKFDEGEGTAVFDLMNDNHFKFPKYPLKAPKWMFSDAPIKVIVKSKQLKKNDVLKTTARKECLKLLFRGPVYKACSKLGSVNVTLSFYYSVCVDAIVSSGIVSQSMDVVIAVADYCMASLNLNYWPARILCNQFPGRRFPDWIGVNCSTPCIFGKASKQNIDECECDPGYYGTNCSNMCPGGSQNTCNKHGLCHSKTGLCDCEINWRGDKTCSKCSDMWIGKDCSLAESKLPTSRLSGTGSLFLDGYITTLDGVSYFLRLAGEYYLLKSVHTDVVIQVRFVGCLKESSCIRSLALRKGSHSLVVQGPYRTSENAVIWLDDKIADIDNDGNTLDQATYGFSIVKVSTGLFLITGSSNSFVLKIRVYGLYLNINFQVSGILCKDSYGLIGSCNRKFIEQYIPTESCSDVHLPKNHFGTKQANQNADASNEEIKNLLNKLSVKECNSLFNYSYRATVEERNTNTGYGLFLDHVAVASSPISRAFSGEYVTIQIMLKTVQFGVVLSYANVKTFFVTSAGGNYSISFGNNVFHTKIQAELNLWCQINIVFKKSNGILQFYYFNSDGLVRRIDINVGVDIFVPGGTLALAGWQPSLDGTGIQPNTIFVGFIDEVRIWTRFFHPAVMLETWKRRVTRTSDLAHMWIFSEGGGYYARDIVAGINFHFGRKPWRFPKWRLSNLRLQEPFYLTKPSFPFRDKDLEISAKKFCDGIFRSKQFNTDCRDLGQGVFDFYFRSCMRRVSQTESLYKSLDVIVAFADYCQSVYNLARWPAQFLCNEFPGENFPEWFGLKCNKRCMFGVKIANDFCFCQQGYWGDECSQVCPGGVSKPCNNHGTCDRKTGKCQCNTNWNGKNDCSQCASGWTGSDCSVAVASLPHRRIAFASCTQGADYTTFDGCSFSFVSVGMFYLIKSPLNFTVQVRQVPCHLQAVCINAIAVKISEDILVFHAPYKDEQGPVIWVNNMLVSFTGQITNLSSSHSDIFLRLNSNNHFAVVWKNVAVINIRVNGKYLSSQFNIDTSYCYKSVGILGACDGNPQNDFGKAAGLVTPLLNTTQHDINQEHSMAFEVTKSKSLFVLDYKQYHEFAVPAGNSYAMFFNKTGAATLPLSKAFPFGSDITLEFLFKPYQLGGTVLSFVAETTFAITINNNIVINYGSEEFDTQVKVEVGIWCQVSMVWYHKTKTLEFYYFSMEGTIQRRKFTILANVFRSSGILVLGQWDPSPGDTESRTNVSFAGLIDEIRVWKQAFDPVLIQQNWKMNVLPSHMHVSALWKFIEGEGNIVFNLVTDEHIFVPHKPWEKPQWVYSDAIIQTNFTSSNKSFELMFRDKKKQKMAESQCIQLFYEGPLNFYCSRLSAVRDFRYIVCLKDISSKGTISAALSSVISFSDYCQTALNLTIWPAQKLCNKFREGSFPLWIGNDCDSRCVFGSADINNPETCVCDKGYWGKDCSKLCPGGILNTCNGHGRCKGENGLCKCELNWGGDQNCSSCSVGWYGFSCEFAVAEITSKTVFFASLGQFGFLSTFSGVHFFHRTYGEFYLIRNTLNNFLLQFRRTPCEYHNVPVALCTTAIAFRYKNVTVTIRAPISTRQTTNGGIPLVWLNGKRIRVDHRTFLSVYFTMTRMSIFTYSINGVDGIKVVLSVERSLGMEIQLPHKYCKNSTGLLGHCKDYTLGLNETNIGNYYDKMALSSAVALNDSLFIYNFSYKEHRSITGGIFCLLFKDSFVRSQPMFIAQNNILTIEFLVKTHEFGGVILAFSHKNTFAVTNERSIKIIYGKKVFDTGIMNEVGKWNQITLVYKRFVGVLQFYHFTSFGKLSIQVVHFDNDVFPDGGVMTLGQWQSSLVQGIPPASTFFGEIDELRIWKRPTNVDLIRRTWRMNVNFEKHPDLLHLWKFNQAKQLVVEDLISSSHLYVVKFHEPRWIFSDADIPTPVIQYKPSDLTEQLEAEQKCFSLILSSSLYDKCKDLGIQVAQFYYKVCLNDLAISRKKSWAVYAVVLYADYCHSVLELDTWPAKELCHHFPERWFPWIGSRCDLRCIFGRAMNAPNASGEITCGCEQGYWGDTCSSLCPGGLLNVCNGHGFCDPVNGTCHCEPHWSGNTTREDGTTFSPCSVCTYGWTGSDCSIAIDFVDRNGSGASIGVGFGDPHFTTAGGLSYHFSVPGAFTLLNTEQVQIQTVQVPCNNKISCRMIKEITMRSSVLVLSFSFTNGSVLKATILDNIKKVTTVMEKYREWRTVGESVRYRWLSMNILDIIFSEETKVILLFYNGKMGFAIETPRSKLNGTLGLLGYRVTKLLGNAHNETGSKEIMFPVNQDEIDRLIDIRSKVQDKESILQSKEETHFTGASYTLDMSVTWLIFSGLPSLPFLTEITLEVWVCLVTERKDLARLCVPGNHSQVSNPVMGRHALLSVPMPDGTLALVYDNGFNVYWSKDKLVSRIRLDVGSWAHLTLTWRSRDGRMQVFVDTGSVVISSTQYNIQTGKYFSLAGAVVLGRYFLDSKPIINYDMTGCLDELRLWQYAKNEKEIEALKSIKFDSYLPGLVLSLPLDEGYGRRARASAYYPLSVIPNDDSLPPNRSIRIPATFLTQPEKNIPQWLPSGVPVKPLTNYTLRFDNNSFEVEAKTTCYKWFYGLPLRKHCSNKLPSQALFYYESCLVDIANSELIESYKLSVSLFALYCQKLLKVEPCLLHGTYDPFPQCITAVDESITVVEIIIISTAIVVFVVSTCIICGVIVTIRRRRNKEKKRRKQSEYVSEPDNQHVYSLDDEDANHSSDKNTGRLQGPLSFNAEQGEFSINIHNTLQTTNIATLKYYQLWSFSIYKMPLSC